MATAWLLRFVDGIEPLNHGCKSTARPFREPGFMIPVNDVGTSLKLNLPPKASVTMLCTS